MRREPPSTRTLVPLKEVQHHRPWATERLLRRLVYERRIPFHKLGPGERARVFLDLADVDTYAEAGRVEARDEEGRRQRAATARRPLRAAS